MKRFSLQGALALILVLVPFGFTARAGEAALEDIVVTNTRDHVLVYFSVVNCFTDDMKEAIQNGIPATFNFFVRLHEKRSFWWDRSLASLKVAHEIKYDNLKKVYVVTLSEKDGDPIVVQDFEKARKLMSEIVGLQVTGLSDLSKGRSYQVRMMTELDKIRLPFYLHYVFFFLSLWDFETDWYTVDFSF